MTHGSQGYHGLFVAVHRQYPAKRVTGNGVSSNDCSALCISYEKRKKYTERYYIGVKNRVTESEYSIKK